MSGRAVGVMGFVLGILLAPLAVDAQPPGRVHRIGFLTLTSPPPPSGPLLATIEAFHEGLREHGWVESQNIVIERRYAEGKFDRLPDLAAELVRLKVDVIVAVAAASARAAKQATTTIPIIMVSAGDPVGTGLVGSLSRPGRNITGTAFDATPEITAKQLQLLMEVVPRGARVGVLWNPTSAFFASYWKELQVAARALGVRLQSLEVQAPNELESAFGAMTRERADALIVLSDSFATFHRGRIADLAAKSRLPAMYGHRQYAEAGGLMSYGPELPHLFRRAATYVDKILKGAKPGDLPVEQPTKFELLVNLKTAKALGLTIPQSVLIRADHVLQ